MTEWEQENLTRELPKSFDDMVLAMLNCEQTPGQTVYQHGMAVSDNLVRLIDHLKGIYLLPDDSWKLPKWLDDYKDKIIENLHHEGRLQLYTLYHDCGKPFCRKVDKKTGQQSFPNHAEVSSHIWACVGGNYIVGKLIANDMVIHTASAEEIAVKLQSEWSCEDSITLILTALAEIHANARLFGGKDSLSFRMKYKTVEKRGKQVCKHWFQQGQ